MPQVITLGELLIDFISLNRDVSLKESEGFIKAPGGAPANVACGLSRLGVDAGFIGKVGNDPFGHYLTQVLQDEGVNTKCMLFDNNARTTLSFVALKSDGVRDCIFYRNPGADLLLAPEEINQEYFTGVNIFAYSSNSFTSDSSYQATLRAIEFAKAEGATIAYDPNLRLGLWDDRIFARERILSGFKYADIVKISDEEAEFITGEKSCELIAQFVHNQGCKLVLVSLGEHGCYYSINGESGYAKSKPIDSIETTGAGDAFFSALLYSFNKRINEKVVPLFDADCIASIAEFANAAGGLATTKMGAIPSLPTLEQVNQFVYSNKIV